MEENCTGVPEGAARWLDGPVSCFLSIAGLIGNAYCLRVLFRTSINTTMLVSLTSLAIWDMVLLLASLFHHSMWITLRSAGILDEPWFHWSVSLNGMLECSRITSVCRCSFLSFPGSGNCLIMHSLTGGKVPHGGLGVQMP